MGMQLFRMQIVALRPTDIAKINIFLQSRLKLREYYSFRGNKINELDIIVQRLYWIDTKDFERVCIIKTVMLWLGRNLVWAKRIKRLSRKKVWVIIGFLFS